MFGVFDRLQRLSEGRHQGHGGGDAGQSIENCLAEYQDHVWTRTLITGMRKIQPNFSPRSQRSYFLILSFFGERVYDGSRIARHQNILPISTAYHAPRRCCPGVRNPTSPPAQRRGHCQAGSIDSSHLPGVYRTDLGQPPAKEYRHAKRHPCRRRPDRRPLYQMS